MVGVLVSSAVTRHSFGYSFSTWRFHLRGLRIAGAHDIGWIREITVESMMQQGPATYAYDLPVSELRQLVPVTAAKRICLVDKDGFYKGIIDVAELHSRDLDNAAAETKVIDLAKGRAFHLLPLQDIRQALDIFSASQMEELPVVQSENNMRIIGALSEPYTLKRYAGELEARNMAQSGAATPAVTD
jgi:CIC family chloride channel protein